MNTIPRNKLRFSKSHQGQATNYFFAFSRMEPTWLWSMPWRFWLTSHWPNYSPTVGSWMVGGLTQLCISGSSCRGFLTVSKLVICETYNSPTWNVKFEQLKPWCFRHLTFHAVLEELSPQETRVNQPLTSWFRAVQMISWISLMVSRRSNNQYQPIDGPKGPISTHVYSLTN